MRRTTSVVMLFAIASLTVHFWPIGVVIAAPQPAAEHTPGELVEAATSGKGFPRQPCLSMEMQGLTANEIAASPKVRNAYEKLAAANRREVAETTAIATLEEQKAVWCLLSCLAGPREDNQIEALRSLERFGDQRAVPFLLIYAEYMAVIESGSENATIHGVVHQSVAKTLSTLTGVKVTIDGQDPEGLKRGIRKWRKWLVDHEQSDADTAGTESANMVLVTRNGEWQNVKIRVFRADRKTAEVVDGKRGVYELSTEGRSWTFPVIAFVGPSCGLPWIGPELDRYLDTGEEVEGFHTIFSHIQWYDSMHEDGDDGQLLAETLKTFDRGFRGEHPANDWGKNHRNYLRRGISTKLRPHIKNPWMFTNGPFDSQGASPRIMWGQVDGESLQLDLTDQMGIFKATVWIDLESRQITTVEEQPDVESDD